MTTSDRTQRLLAIAEGIVRLENEIDVLRAEFHRLIEEGHAVRGRLPTSARALRGRPRSPVSITSAVLQALTTLQTTKTHIHDGFSAADVIEAIEKSEAHPSMRRGVTNLGSVHAALSKLVHRGQIARVAQGRYRA